MIAPLFGDLRRPRFASLLLVVAILAACAQPPKADLMVPEVTAAPTARGAKTIAIWRVGGGEKTGEDQMDLSRIDDQAFTAALSGTLEKSGLFRRVVVGDEGDYRLEAQIVSQELGRPFLEFKNVGELVVHYRLYGAQDRAVIWQETIESHFEKGFTETFDAKERERLVIEGAARENLADLVSNLAQVVH
ncbi:MAG: hypothetical protein QNJ94_19475 [Alphaproteobacteria bacterium]|nr:hypothetical protein [Alphaproteobacteria bacterium]